MGVIELDLKRRTRPHLCDSLEVFKYRCKQNRLDALYETCCICNWDRGQTHYASLDPDSYDFDTIVPLCANHRIEFDRISLTETETAFIQEFLWNVGKFLGRF